MSVSQIAAQPWMWFMTGFLNGLSWSADTLALHCTWLCVLNKRNWHRILGYLSVAASEVPASLLLFNEAEVLSSLHVSSGLPLSSKGITKLIIEEKMWCILVVYSSSFTRVWDTRQTHSTSDVASVSPTLCFILWPNYNAPNAIQLGFLMHRCGSQV